MKNAAKICAIIVFVSLAGFRADAAQAPTAAELLDRYAENADKMKSIIFKTYSLTEIVRTYSIPGQPAMRRTMHSEDEHRLDGERGFWSFTRWGNVAADGGWRDKGDHYGSRLYDGKSFYQHSKSRNSKTYPNGKVYLTRSNIEKGSIQLATESTLPGFYSGNNGRIDKVLRQGRRLSVRERMENIGGANCYVIDAVTRYGRQTVWIDPERGHNVRKFVISRKPGDKNGYLTLKKGQKYDYHFEVQRFKKVEDAWITEQYSYRMAQYFTPKDVHSGKTNGKLIEVTLDPDHEALGSFSPHDVPNGAVVYLMDVKRRTYTWQGGKVVDKDGKVIMDCTAEPKNDSEQAQSEMLGKKPGDVRSLLRKRAAGQAGSERAASESSPPTARELLDKYTDALNAVRSFTTREESVKKLDYAFDRGFSDRSMAGVKRRGQRQYSRGQKRTDGKHFHWRQYSWGNLGPAHGDVDETQAHYNCDNWDGVTLYGHAGNVKVPGIVTLSKPTASQVEHPMSRTPPVSYLVGYNMESDERMDSILRKAKNISVSSRMENVGGSDCYVIRAKTDKGTISLWIDPAHGYNLAKAEARLSEGDFSFDYRLKRGESRVTKLENVRFERVNGVWVPMEADVSQHRNYSGGTVNEDYHYKRTEFVLDPDHEALGSFDNPIENPKNDPELKNGTDVCRLGDPDRYIWQDGKVIMGGSRGKTAGSAESQP